MKNLNAQSFLFNIAGGLILVTVVGYMVREQLRGHTVPRILTDIRPPKVDVFFVYPEELRNSKRVAVFRDFLLAKLQQRGGDRQ